MLLSLEKNENKRTTAWFRRMLVGLGMVSFVNIGIAQENKNLQHPPIMPTRDATVVYAVQLGNSSLFQQTKIYFSGQGQLMRIDGPNNIGMTVIDNIQQRAIIAMNKSRIYAIIPRKAGEKMFFLDETMQFERKGSERVADILCNKYKVTAKTGKSDVCITKDGVILKQEGKDVDGMEGTMTALSVDYTPIPAAMFQPPIGYQQVQLPKEKNQNPVPVKPDSNSQPLAPLQAKPVESEHNIQSEPAPFVTPQHDVDVVYAIAGPMPGLPPFHQRMRWSVSEWKQRIDSQGVDTYMVTDYRNKQLVVVNEALKKKTTMPAPGASITAPGVRPSGDYVKVGEATIAGATCTDWHMIDTDGNPNDVCYTDDGVMLRVTRNNIPLVVAIKVNRSAQPSNLFQIPSGLKELAPEKP